MGIIGYVCLISGACEVSRQEFFTLHRDPTYTKHSDECVGLRGFLEYEYYKIFVISSTVQLQYSK